MYKAFVSSTFDDLSQHRAEAIQSLQRAGFLVDNMENWQADRDTPVRFSAARLDGCKLCILLVGFRRGSVPQNASRSITQIEYDEARKRKIDVLPFLLADQTPVGNSGWSPAFDERKTDSRVDEWRKTLRLNHGVGDFSADPKSLRIEPALARWVVQTESDRAAHFRRSVTGLLAGFFLVVAAGLLYIWHAYQSPELRSQYHSRYLAFDDPKVFNSAKDGQYSVVRVLPDSGALRQETNLNAEFAATQFSLDLFANTAQNVHDQLAKTLETIIRTGAKVRFILWDYTPQNKAFYDAFQFAINQNPEEPRAAVKRVRRDLEQLQKQVAEQRAVYKGSFELRWNEKPLFYTMWIRDWDERNRTNALGHLGVHFYRDQAYWPSFRVSAEDGGDLLDNMHREFEYAWKTSAARIPRDPPDAQ